MISHPRLVLVDNDASYRDPLASLLAKDFQVIVATCGQEGLSRMLTMRPDLVLLGLSVRSVDGLQMLRTIAHHERCREIPLVLLAFPPVSLEELHRRGFHVDDLVIKDRSLWKELPPRLLSLVRSKQSVEVGVQSRGRFPSAEPKTP